ncbi:MAG TPA: hypothetical protein VMX17_05395 [Candidatus Glassbacteria bacterium]|nr:hypothetical protein [Candidatus Glassbacteria bacterium]
MSSYYQIVKPFGVIDEILKTMTRRNLSPVNFKINSGNEYLALKITPENLNNFDNSVKDLKIKYKSISTDVFEKLIQYAYNNKIKIRKITTEPIEEEIDKEIFDDYFIKRDFDHLIEFINDKRIVIKKIDLSFESNMFSMYESGIIWSENELSSSPIKELVKSLLSFF